MSSAKKGTHRGLYLPIKFVHWLEYSIKLKFVVYKIYDDDNDEDCNTCQSSNCMGLNIKN